MVKKTIQLETNNLILRKINLNDAQAMFDNWANDEEVTKYLNWNPHGNIQVTRNIINSWINLYNNDFFFQWVIEYKNNKEIIGTISLFNYKVIVSKNNEINRASLELGYCLAKTYWNRGLTSEAVNTVLNFAFHSVNVESVYARHVKENIASGKVMKKNNMKFIEEVNEFISSRNKKEIMHIYRIQKEDFR